MPELQSSPPSLKSCQGHVAHLKRLIAQWTHRRDEGDCCPSKEKLTEWIDEATSSLDDWEKKLAAAS